MAEIDKIVDQLSKLTVMEATDLAKKLEDVWEIKHTTPAAVVAAPQGDLDPGKGKEKSEYDVILDSVGDKKISVIKEVKSITGLTLKEARDLIESPPKPIKTALAKGEAEELKAKLEATGAKVSLK